MGGQGIGDRQDRTIGGRRKASEIEKKHAIGASPRDREGTSTLRNPPRYVRSSYLGV